MPVPRLRRGRDVAAGDHHGAVPEASAFAGWRFQIPCDHCVAQIEVPIGLRLDARPGVGGAPTSFALAAEVDVVTIAVTLIRVMLEPHVPPG